MFEAESPENESQRLAVLHGMGILDTPDEDRFDRITHLASRRFHAPVAVVSLVDAHRQWFKSCIGLPMRETPRHISFCAHVVARNALLVVHDMLQDEVFRTHPLVRETPKVRFYAGFPVHAPGGALVGTLSVADFKPRPFDVEDIEDLETMAGWVEREFAAR